MKITVMRIGPFNAWSKAPNGPLESKSSSRSMQPIAMSASAANIERRTSAEVAQRLRYLIRVTSRNSTWAFSRIPFSPDQMEKPEASPEVIMVVIAGRGSVGLKSGGRIPRLYIGSKWAVRSTIKWQGGPPSGDSHHDQESLESMSLACGEKMLVSTRPSMIERDMNGRRKSSEAVSVVPDDPEIDRGREGQPDDVGKQEQAGRAIDAAVKNRHPDHQGIQDQNVE